MYCGRGFCGGCCLISCCWMMCCWMSWRRFDCFVTGCWICCRRMGSACWMCCRSTGCWTGRCWIRRCWGWWCRMGWWMGRCTRAGGLNVVDKSPWWWSDLWCGLAILGCVTGRPCSLEVCRGLDQRRSAETEEEPAVASGSCRCCKAGSLGPRIGHRGSADWIP